MIMAWLVPMALITAWGGGFLTAHALVVRAGGNPSLALLGIALLVIASLFTIGAWQSFSEVLAALLFTVGAASVYSQRWRTWWVVMFVAFVLAVIVLPTFVGVLVAADRL
jgi:hypothetical protein